MIRLLGNKSRLLKSVTQEKHRLKPVMLGFCFLVRCDDSCAPSRLLRRRGRPQKTMAYPTGACSRLISLGQRRAVLRVCGCSE